MRTTTPLAFLMLTIASCLATSVNAENWPSWRGPLNNGISSEKNLPTAWSTTENVAWRVKLPGSGGATPAVWGENIFVTSAADDELILQCIGTDGKERWKQTVSTGNRNVRGDEGNSAAPSPSTDGKHVWVMFGNGALACFTVGGERVWQIDLQERYGKFKIAFGMTSTPVLDGNKLYLQLIHGEGNADTREAVVAAVNALTGAPLWTHDRASDAVAECEHSYASPMLYNYEGRKMLLSHGADYMVAHDTDSGDELWRLGDLNVASGRSKYDRTLRFVASPACADGLIVVPSAKGGPCIAVAPTGEDTGHIVKWTRKKTPDVPSPLILDDLVYLCMQNGNLFCLDRETGEEFYEARTHVDRHRASPVYADGHIYLTARDGVISVVKVGKEFELVSQNEMGESIAASPAISGGTIYLRSFDSLWAIRR